MKFCIVKVDDFFLNYVVFVSKNPYLNGVWPPTRGQIWCAAELVDVDNGHLNNDDNGFGLNDATHSQAAYMRGEWITQEGQHSSDIPSEIAIKIGPWTEENPHWEPENDIDDLSVPELFNKEKQVCSFNKMINLEIVTLSLTLPVHKKLP